MHRRLGSPQEGIYPTKIGLATRCRCSTRRLCGSHLWRSSHLLQASCGGPPLGNVPPGSSSVLHCLEWLWGSLGGNETSTCFFRFGVGVHFAGRVVNRFPIYVRCLFTLHRDFLALDESGNPAPKGTFNRLRTLWRVLRPSYRHSQFRSIFFHPFLLRKDNISDSEISIRQRSNTIQEMILSAFSLHMRVPWTTSRTEATKSASPESKEAKRCCSSIKHIIYNFHWLNGQLSSVTRSDKGLLRFTCTRTREKKAFFSLFFLFVTSRKFMSQYEESVLRPHPESKYISGLRQYFMLWSPKW